MRITLGLVLLALCAGACHAAPERSHRRDERAGETRPAVARNEPPGRPAPRPGMIAIAGGMVRTRDLTAERVVTVPGFWIDPVEVSAGDYWRCIDAGACRPPWTALRAACNLTASDRRDHPMNCLEREHAAAYCRWTGKRLPSAAEWQLAAAGSEGRLYPWGNQPGAAERSCRNGESTCPVGSASGATPQGVRDLSGNVWEMTDRACGTSAPRAALCARFTTLVHGGGFGGCPYGPGRCQDDGRTLSVQRIDDVASEAVGFRCAEDL